ncbi:Coiled-coil domain-containing protein 93 [Anabarilius grahami]|uniref:Coiled-coil domain-containing protein 93 n=1 Tax=Anabarilius grahami TaxID=495550 RepID=A0A3N0YW73_ANAGA|nr:Coiled-coil domain-containing protein 93 [Anabarilius grahami]
MAATSVFQRVRTGSKIGAQYDQEGNLIKVETREDEEQSVKLAEILELLLAAGYFRARIKGLSPFDKVVGGMTWCITTCNFDIDVDLLFQENSTIGQKIALTEKIVSVLPRMKCPHRLEPHQIQGLDFIHIFPVVQWLVKKAIETREEMGDYVRSYSISQFQKAHAFPEDEEFALRKERAISTVVNVCEVYAPQRRYKRQVDAGELLDEESRVHSTLLEFGRRYGFSKQSKAGTAVEQKQVLAQGTQGVPPGMAQVSEEEDLQAAEELRIKALMTGMAAMATEEGKLSASTVGQIVGLQSEEIKQIATEYAEKAERSVEDRPERFGPAQQHRRQLASLNKQITQKTNELAELQSKQQEARVACEDAKVKLAEATAQTEKLERELSSLEDVESQADSGLLEKLRALVAMNENLKHQEQTFRSHCREEMTRLQQNIEELKLESGDEGDDKKEMNMMIDQQYTADREKLQKIRLLMAKRNREIAILQRKIDEVPNRAELTQYQKRFIELYSQALLSFHKRFARVRQSGLFELLFMFADQCLHMEKKRQENKMRRDQLNDEYLELLDKQRLYFKTVKDFKEECRKNEMLLSKLRAKGAS